MTSVSEGSPFVIVPVLARTTVRIRCAVSRASAERISTPFSAPFPVPTMIESGVARPSAHGQAMMSTDTALTSPRVSAGSGPRSNHTTNAPMAMKMTTGTKSPATRSASRWIGALEAWASRTSRTIWARTVSDPTAVAR
jgi:hypothetical protein